MEDRIERAEIDIVERAENVMKSLKDESDGSGSKQYGSNRPVKMITVSQIRKFLAAVNSLTNKIERYKLLNPKEFKENGIPEDLAAEIQYLRVSLAYQSGRYPEEVKVFVDKADLLDKIVNIENDYKKYVEFARYVEALVAYHKYYGGKD
ncbi:MAG: type III-A CRISPR-associated protein Csm2 [Anaeroglobus sp.]